MFVFFCIVIMAYRLHKMVYKEYFLFLYLFFFLIVDSARFCFNDPVCCTHSSTLQGFFFFFFWFVSMILSVSLTFFENNCNVSPHAKHKVVRRKTPPHPRFPPICHSYHRLCYKIVCTRPPSFKMPARVSTSPAKRGV